jgi:uncharacterized protein (TIGR02598 family)
MVVLTSETVACELLKVTAVREPTSFLKLIHFIARDREVRRGFSLVEVTLAIAVVSFALTGVLALIPSGMLAIQSAVSSQATANIADQLRGQMQQLSFSGTTDSISSLPTTTYYYTTEGVPTTQSLAYYKATFAVSSINPTSTLSGGDISFKANSAQNVLVTLSYPPSTWSKNYSFSLLVARSNL